MALQRFGELVPVEAQQEAIREMAALQAQGRSQARCSDVGVQGVLKDHRKVR